MPRQKFLQRELILVFPRAKCNGFFQLVVKIFSIHRPVSFKSSTETFFKIPHAFPSITELSKGFRRVANYLHLHWDLSHCFSTSSPRYAINESGREAEEEKQRKKRRRHKEAGKQAKEKERRKTEKEQGRREDGTSAARGPPHAGPITKA